MAAAVWDVSVLQVAPVGPCPFHHSLAIWTTYTTGNDSQANIVGIDEVYEMDVPRQRDQWLVSARRDGVLSIMTPVFPDEENLSLLLNQVQASAGLSLTERLHWQICNACKHLCIHVLDVQ